MQNEFNDYSVYDIFVKFNNSSEEGKIRPVAIIKIKIEKLSVQGFGVYSYKDKFEDKFKSSFYERFLYRVQDSQDAGLNPQLISYIDVSRVELFELDNLFQNAHYRGRLSKRDVQGLIKKYKEYRQSN